jgi:probable addiction module antidote protein
MMNEPIHVQDLPEFDMAEQLQNEEDIANYLSLVMEDGDTDEFKRALGYVAKARGMTQIANDSGLGRESLYKALRPGSRAEFSTISKVLKALNLDIQVVPRHVA